ncbi:MAG: hypothetical protein KGJ84_01275 [Elusimicrobia bacterium]|nr:hypothetical protein [Elusimicrobiota bacterium]
MNGLKSLTLAAALAAAGAGAASAEIVLEGVHWQVGRVEAGRVTGWRDLKVLVDGPPKLDNRLRARLVLKNDGAKAEEGLLIRSSMTARVAPSSGNAEGSWAIPFDVEERRVPKIGANQVVEIPLETGAAMEIYLRRIARAGWWPDLVKLQVMLEPRSSEAALQTVEDSLEIKKEPKP